MMAPLGWLYEKIVDLRNTAYDNGLFRTYDLGAPTISVGNITVGGTGKTPLVVNIVRLLHAKGEKVCVISRGYKRENEKKRVLVSDGKSVLSDVREAGDEPYELATKLLGKAIIISDADRVSAGKWASAKFKVSCFILDDAYQHRKAKRDLNILTIDAMNPFGNRKSLPAGILRENLRNLNRAEIVVITRSNLSKHIAEISRTIHEYNPSADIFVSATEISRVLLVSDFLSGRESNVGIRKEKALAFCALGNPNNFFDQLTLDGFNLVSKKALRDHHRYAQSDISKIESEAIKSGAEFLVTTAKDAVKLGEIQFQLPCYVVETKLNIKKEKELRKKIFAVLKN